MSLYRHPSENDVKIMLHKKKLGWKVEEIAQYTNFSKSTISRNLNLCLYYQWKMLVSKTIKISKYHIDIWKQHKERIQFAKERIWKYNSIIKFEQFIAFVNHQINDKIASKRVQYSPQALIDMFKTFSNKDCPSHTIFYHWIETQKFGFKRYLFKNMMQYRQRIKRVGKRPPRFTPIHHRPSEANDRLELGHLEIDSVEGKKSDKFCLATMLDRKSGQFAMHPFKNKCPTSFLNAVRINLLKFPEVKTITLDNGVENAQLGVLEKAGIKLYNTDSYASYQKGSLEVTHKFIRRFYPKGTSFNDLSYQDMQAIEKYINEYPRPTFKMRYNIF